MNAAHSGPALPREIGWAVIGGGIVGMVLALRLAQDGADVAVLDDGAHAGTTANAGSLHVQMQSRFMRMYPELVPNLERSLPLYPAAVREWQALAAELATPIELKVSGGLMVAEDAAQFAFLAEKCARERRLGLDSHMLERAELLRLAPYLGEAAYGAELCAHEGKLNPLLANRTIWRACRAAGVVHLPQTRVARIARQVPGAGFVVETARGRLRAGRVALAAGAGTGALAAMLGVHVPTEAEPLHMNITEATEPTIHHLVQHAERPITLKQLGLGQVVIGGGWPARFEGPERRPATIQASMIGNLRLAGHMVPQLAGLRILRSWAGVNTTTDGQCTIGWAPGQPGLFVAVPGDAGYTLGPLVARLAAAEIAGRDPGFDLAPFGPARFAAPVPPA
ncbi:MAG: FAD-binding oxidoreductase [Alphaproteobacteria bacterium]|nr:FAD-binding oxidoreductase [Alphaproteobacteria bacterium]